MDQCKSTLSASRQELLELIEQIPFGKLENILINNGEPDLTRPPVVTREIKLGLEEMPRVSRSGADYVLKSQFIDLFSQLDRLGDGSTVTIEIRHSLPARLIVSERCS
jgi:hypothetical protein